MRLSSHISFRINLLTQILPSCLLGQKGNKIDKGNGTEAKYNIGGMIELNSIELLYYITISFYTVSFAN